MLHLLEKLDPWTPFDVDEFSQPLAIIFVIIGSNLIVWVSLGTLLLVGMVDGGRGGFRASILVLAFVFDVYVARNVIWKSLQYADMV